MEFLSVLPLYREGFLRLLFPSFCALCNQILELEEQGLCLSCRGNLQKLRLPPSEERIRLPLLFGDEGWALFRYEDAMKEVLHRIKFDGRRDLVRIFIPEISSFCKRRPQLASYDCLVPIPLDPRRRLEREFNQSGLLAERVREALGIRLESRGILKRRSTSPQSILGREARKLNLEHAFRIPDSSRILGRSILLVDDIFTTGATVEEAAKTLKEAGASRVCYLALARAWSN